MHLYDFKVTVRLHPHTLCLLPLYIPPPRPKLPSLTLSNMTVWLIHYYHPAASISQLLLNPGAALWGVQAWSLYIIIVIAFLLNNIIHYGAHRTVVKWDRAWNLSKSAGWRSKHIESFFQLIAFLSCLFSVLWHLLDPKRIWMTTELNFTWAWLKSSHTHPAVAFLIHIDIYHKFNVISKVNISSICHAIRCIAQQSHLVKLASLTKNESLHITSITQSLDASYPQFSILPHIVFFMCHRWTL